MAFDKRGLEGYVEVNERIIEFYATYPEGGMKAEIVQLTDTLVVMKAYAYRSPNDPLPGIGHSCLEIPGKTPYTRGSEIENCETSAWGRALACLGIKVKRSIASKEEVDNKQQEFHDKIVDSGVLTKLFKAGKKEADGKKEVEEKAGKTQEASEGGAEAPKRTDAELAAYPQGGHESTISPGDINDMLAALTSAAGIWGTDYVAGCLKTWAARPVPNIERLGQDGAVDVALIDSLTENDHQVSKFHGRLKKLQAAVEKAGVTV